ncbi:hypothetical protein [Fictibacillus barbaricus]|uniref:hypothetical protein n=1 Tax=Fictibacillus barbaricus TaxID=182136 RepID=UPI001669D021
MGYFFVFVTAITATISDAKEIMSVSVSVTVTISDTPSLTGIATAHPAYVAVPP